MLVNYKKDRNIVFLVSLEGCVFSRVIVYFYSAGVLTCIVIGSSVIIVYLYICSVSKVIKLCYISVVEGSQFAQSEKLSLVWV